MKTPKKVPLIFVNPHILLMIVTMIIEALGSCLTDTGFTVIVGSLSCFAAIECGLHRNYIIGIIYGLYTGI